MARLVVLRGETPHREIDLVRLPLRIGRAQQNDVVLEDPLKSVSREHAEVRLQDGRYVLVDLGSENGIWVAGSRVPQVVLDPNVVASIGPFRVSVKADAPMADAPAQTMVLPTIAIPTAGTPPPPAPAEVKTTAPAPAPQKPAAAPAAAKSPAPAASAKPSAAAKKPAAAAASGAAKKNTGKALGIAAAVLAAIAVVAVAIVALRRPAPAPPPEPPDVSREIAAAEQQIGQNACAEALEQNIAPALARDPQNASLLSLKQRAEACLAAVVEPPLPPPPNADLELAKTMLDQQDCAGALDRVNVVLAAQPENAEALQLKTAVDGCFAAVKPAAAAPTLAVALPPEKGGLTPLPKELDRDYQSRVKAMRSRYDDAVAAAAKNPTRGSIAALEAIQRDASPRYLEIAAKISEARAAWRATAEPVLAEARGLAAKEMWNEAIRRFNDAREIDPNLPVDAEIKKVEAAKLAQGREECRLGRLNISYNRPVALQHFKRALALLPQDDACYADAKRYVEQ